MLVLLELAEQEGLEPPTLSGSRFQGGFFIQPGLLRGLDLYLSCRFHFTTSGDSGLVLY